MNIGKDKTATDIVTGVFVLKNRDITWEKSRFFFVCAVLQKWSHYRNNAESQTRRRKKTLARIRTTAASEGETNSPTPGKNNALHHFCLKDDNLRLGKRTCTKTAPLKLRRSARSEVFTARRSNTISEQKTTLLNKLHLLNKHDRFSSLKHEL